MQTTILPTGQKKTPFLPYLGGRKGDNPIIYLLGELKAKFFLHKLGLVRDLQIATSVYRKQFWLLCRTCSLFWREAC